MEESFPIPNKKLCLAVFIICCLILTVFYYDNTFIEYASEPYTDNLIWDVQNNSNITNRTSKRFLPEPTAHNLHFNTTINNTINCTSTANSTPATSVSTAATLFNLSFVATAVVLPENTTTTKKVVTTIPTPKVSKDGYSRYLVLSPKCKIPDLIPFSKEAKKYFKKLKYKSCTSKKLLTTVNVTDNIATLYVETKRVPSYSGNGVTCCYSNVSRVHYEKNPDSKIKYSPCQYFDKNITVFNGPAYVKCLDLKTRREVYENVHFVTLIDEQVQKKINKFDNTTNTFSVLLVGIDSISRLNFIRTLPNTYNFVEQNGWVPLMGYNKMDDNTFPNLMAILTGFNTTQAYGTCKPSEVKRLDTCPLIWYDFRKLGYITGYAEDYSPISTFNYYKKGFSEPPSDYYYRPYVIATEKLTNPSKEKKYLCTGPESAGERILNLAKDFAVTFKDFPNFGFFWMNAFSHNELNTPSGMDDKIRDFLEDITNKGVTNNTIVIFISDHGIRFGSFRETLQGWLEERLPFIYVSFPDWFKEKYRKEFENFKTNSNRLTTPYDLHMTLQHILILSGREYNVTKSKGCPNCKTLFEEAEADRSCAEAGINQHWCTCSGYKSTTLEGDIKTRVLTFILDQIQDIINLKKGDQKCAKYSVASIVDSRISSQMANNVTYLLLRIRMNPKAVFESTISFVGDIHNSNFSLSGDISRLDSYKDHSKCVSDAYLKKYCYCQLNGRKA